MGAQVSAILSEFQNTQMKLLEVSLENFNSISGKLDARMEAELDRVTRILENAALITERTERIIAARESDISLSVMEMRIALENIRQISGEIAAGRGNMGQAIYDDRVYENLVSTLEETEKAVVKMQSVIDGAGEFVGRANGLGIKLDTRIDYGFLRNQVMAGASVRLEPASGVGWYRVGVNTAPEGVASRTVTTTTVSGVPGTTVVDETENKYTFSIDAEIARRIGIVTLRGGILENTAGIGVDVQPLKWMMVSAEAFRFRSNEVPNLRGTLTFYPFFDPDSRNPLRWLYLQGGITDALSDSRDFFAGGGLRFSDHDIKGMVGLATGVAGAR
jgi:phospholipid/cholesterol/gamma-HCH transport system substrate-binding protein